ncbi:MAG TPA: ABC transporter ATP-binding protein [Caldisericia bacterium]|nr:ABC transporter ATP-binding protein [Caldisericia bacterium]
MNIAEVRDLSKQYGKFDAVRSISFDLQQGEVFGFLGPNGAGKTTTINMMTGLARPTSGSIRVAGFDGIREIKKVQGRIGIVPDESNVYEELSGLENLLFCASLYGMEKSKRTQRAKALLDQFGLADTGKKLFKHFSKGMKRKLTIAAGIIHEPEILFLDEPTTGIDVESARQIRKLIKDLHAQGSTIFLTTHYIEEAERLCDRIGFIVGGQVVSLGRLEDLMQAAQKDHQVVFAFENGSEKLEIVLAQQFPQFSFYREDAQSLRIVSEEKIDLMPLMKFFDSQQLLMREARIIRPSLEEVFVKITGIGLDKMKKEKEGKKK